jgi:hypothetical protein
MTLEEALEYFNSGYHLCQKLRITPTNAYKWKKNNFIPVKNQFLINKVIGEDLPIDMSKEEMEIRLLGEIRRVPIND